MPNSPRNKKAQEKESGFSLLPEVAWILLTVLFLVSYSFLSPLGQPCAEPQIISHPTHSGLIDTKTGQPITRWVNPETGQSGELTSSVTLEIGSGGETYSATVIGDEKLPIECRQSKWRYLFLPLMNIALFTLVNLYEKLTESTRFKRTRLGCALGLSILWVAFLLCPYYFADDGTYIEWLMRLRYSFNDFALFLIFTMITPELRWLKHKLQERKQK